MIDAISKLVESGAISEDVQKSIQEACQFANIFRMTNATSQMTSAGTLIRWRIWQKRTLSVGFVDVYLMLNMNS